MSANINRLELARKILRLPKEEQVLAATAALKKFGEKPNTGKFKPYQFEPTKYIEDFLQWSPWSGMEGFPGQAEILAELALSVKQQIEKRDFDKGNISESDLTCWSPGQKIKNWFRIESGNGIGKTKLLSGVVQWFFDCFDSVVYTFHTSAEQDEVTTWAEIGEDRKGKSLPGRVLTTKIHLSPNRFAMSKTTSNAKGSGEERTKGKHKPFLCFVTDESDGIEDYVYKSIETMASGGIVIVLMTANPRSRASYFHRMKKFSYVKTFRISSLSHPNVVAGKEIIPGAVMRDFIEKQMENGVEVVEKHNEDEFTFELPYSIEIKGNKYEKGTVFRPKPEFMWTVLGIAPPNSMDKTIISVGVYENACKRDEYGTNSSIARVGVDAARWGKDKGTVYIRHQNRIWKAAALEKQDTYKYVDAIKKAVLPLKEKGVTSLHIRVDAGYGNAIIDALRIDDDLIKNFKEFKVLEVQFGGTPYNSDYYNTVTEMYYETAETLKSLSVINPPEILELDLTEREYEFRNQSGKIKKILEDKEKFRKRVGHSPDDGDGFVLAASPDYIFDEEMSIAPLSLDKVSIWTG